MEAETLDGSGDNGGGYIMQVVTTATAVSERSAIQTDTDTDIQIDRPSPYQIPREDRTVHAP
eukprot:840657-Rhodomonas_salina.2